jgi:adenosylcobinamide-GDP ribazoletransferase
MTEIMDSFLVAVQFLTRLPVPRRSSFPVDALAKAAVFFPVVGLLVAAGGVVLNLALSPLASRNVVVVVVLAYLVIVTGGLHEDALADAADGFGGGWKKEQILDIMRDSRIGSFGAIAIALGLLARFVFLANLPLQKFDAFLVAGQVLSRWTALPLAYILPPARGHDGQGSLVAEKITAFSLVTGTALMLAIVAAVLRTKAVWTVLAAVVVTAISALYYRSRISGVTGDCLGATNQLTEVTVYLTGVVLR